jgi:hypothetical protein
MSHDVPQPRSPAAPGAPPAAARAPSPFGAAAAGPASDGEHDTDEGLPMPEPFKIKSERPLAGVLKAQGARGRLARGSAARLPLSPVATVPPPSPPLPPPPPPPLAVVESISLLPRPQRAARLRQAGYNVFCLKSSEVFIDLLTDSGMSALSDRQWAGMLVTPQAYAGAARAVAGGESPGGGMFCEGPAWQGARRALFRPAPAAALMRSR